MKKKIQEMIMGIIYAIIVYPILFIGFNVAYKFYDNKIEPWLDKKISKKEEL